MSEINSIFERIKGYYGIIPLIFQTLSRNPDLLEAYFEKSQALIVNSLSSNLSFEEIELISIGAAAALGSEHCLGTHIKILKDHDIDEEKVFNAILLGSMIAETSSLSKSLRIFEEVYNRT
ncbi:carboxymuconolactone decarboxylase family protein [Candidatus Methanoliparum sp. LAM-1]|uniref:carboxymuconolactone decarboxylase family protein n=1 Tax=Candidatus Methanoliparum sp. LAM-1 TaxID=2874846 RepID=UPI001E33C64E|nr:carboxymuconolactone decarboxylase family protein [Candidatus Methanoliparum sp. LAM-1]BDC35326.1 hypothetical protein MTLP_00080 [Candidatus Methanoliparum sp. LAM-1]